jgi:MoaA/NifB/PqqE/SkfB family radical SAM enzyme
MNIQNILEVDWHLTNRCNFDCYYCHPQIKKVLNRKSLSERTPKQCFEAFNKLAPCCHILMSGGEPFLFPNFIELCTLVTERHFISLNTNLSNGEIDKFALAINPEKVKSILAAIHIEERARLGIKLNEFIRNYLALQNAGFNITAAYVLHPTILPSAAEDFAELRAAGVGKLAGKVFKGVHDGKRYPDSYTSSEAALVRQLAGEYKMTPIYLARQMSYYGEYCNAGVKSVKIDVEGNIQRCATVREHLGNLFDNSLQLHTSSYPCSAQRVLVVSQCQSMLDRGVTA